MIPVVPIDVARIRAALGFGFDEGAAWFSVDERETGFAPQKSPGHRAILLACWSSGPVVVVYARSASSKEGVESPPHRHRPEFPSCWLSKHARVVTSYPLAVRRGLLTDDSYMCSEPYQGVTTAVLSAASSI